MSKLLKGTLLSVLSLSAMTPSVCVGAIWRLYEYYKTANIMCLLVGEYLHAKSMSSYIFTMTATILWAKYSS